MAKRNASLLINPRNGDSLNGLSEEERESMNAMANVWPGGHPSFKSPIMESKPQEPHDDESPAQNGEIAKLRKKLDETKDELKDARDERNSYKSRFEKKVEELKAAEERNNDLVEDKRRLTEENAGLKESLKNASRSNAQNDASELSKLRKDNRRLSDDCEKLSEELDSVRKELTDAKAAKADAEFRLGEILKEQEKASASAPALDMGPVGTVSRINPDTLRSDLFTHPRYKAVISRDGSRLTFTPDIEGGAVCRDGRITLPKLATMLDYSGECEYKVFSADGHSFMVSLR